MISDKREFLFEGFSIRDLFSTTYIERREIYIFMKELASKTHESAVVLDFGCGRMPYRPLFHVSNYIGLDIEQSGHSIEDKAADLYYDGRTIPLPDNSIDLILCNQVMEHIPNITEILSELHRIIKPGGG